MRPRVLVTGFGPFPGAPENPTETLVEGLRDGWEGAAECELATAVLPTRYHAARELALRLHRRLRPDIAIHFGFSLQAKGFTLERLAANRIVPGRLDAGGGRPARRLIRETGPRACPNTLPLGRIHAALRKHGLPVAYSDDAGGYVCNLVFYGAAAGRHPMAGFVHVPLISEMTPRPGQRAGRGLITLSRAQLIAGTRAIVAACAAEWRRREPDRKKSRPRAAGGPVAFREEMPKEGHRA